jgi:acetolactate synthase-1/2/3 large subunit
LPRCRTGVALVTAGPGLTDCVTAIANAWLDCVPTLFVAGAAPLRDAELLPLQGGFDQLALVAPITKWAHRVTHTHRIPDLVAQALRVAGSGRPGPVYLELPIDVLFARVDAKRVRQPSKVGPDAPPAPPAAAVEQAIAWLHAAERPAIVVGGGARFAGAAGELAAFAEETGIPVFSNGRGTASCQPTIRSAAAASHTSRSSAPPAAVRPTSSSCSARASASSPGTRRARSSRTAPG